MKNILIIAIAPLLLVLTSDTVSAATALAFGLNAYGRTGVGTTIGYSTVATPIVTSNLPASTVRQISAGSAYSLLLSNNGTVYSFGANSDGRTGQGVQHGDTLIATLIDTSNLGGRSIKQISAGGNHSHLLADDGVVFSFGANFQGEAGIGTAGGRLSSALPIDTTNLSGKVIKQVSAGSQHSLLLASDGSAYSFGTNGFGRTGLGTDVGDSLHATPIDTTNIASSKIIQVTAGNLNSLLLSEDGVVYSFGPNSHGRNGNGMSSGSTLIATAIDTTNLGGKKITQISAGLDHSLLLADDGSVFAFGRNRYGKTGLGTSIGDTTIATAIDTTYLTGKIITQVEATESYSLLLASDGSVFSFGSIVGLDLSSGNSLIATPVDLTYLTKRRVVEVSGYDGYHGLLLTIPEPSAVNILLPTCLLIGMRNIRKSRNSSANLIVGQE